MENKAVFPINLIIVKLLAVFWLSGKFGVNGGDSGLQFERLEEIPVDMDYTTVRVTESGNIVDITYMTHLNRKQTIAKLDQNHILVVATGEILETQSGDSRLAHKNYLYSTFRNIRNLVNANVTDVQNCLWCTLTYAENMTDDARLMRDFDAFRKRFQRYLEKNGLDKPEYISVPEPQQRGAWHLHIIYIWQHKAPYIANEVLRKLWGNGFVSVKALSHFGESCDNVGAYLTAYLGDLEIESETAIPDGEHILEKYSTGDGKTIPKKVIKGGRLNLYPPGFKMVRHSSGVKYPDVYDSSYADIKEKVSGGTETFSSCFRLIDSENDFETLVVKKQFNLKRKASQ